MITIIGRRLIIPDCDRILGVVGDKNTPVKIKLSENTLESYLPGAEGFGDVAIILKLEHETTTVTVPPILCVHDKEGVYVGDLSILSSVNSGLVSAQAMIVLPGSATDKTALDDAQSIWQSDEDYFYIADDIELKSFSNSSDTYTDFQNLLAAVGKNVVAAELAKDAAETAESNAEGAEERINETVKSFNEAYGDFSEQAKKAKEHYDSRSNPHEVTAEQVGAYDKNTVEEKFFNVNFLIDEAHSQFSFHEADDKNPHKVTAEQVDAYDKETIDSKLVRYDLMVENTNKELTIHKDDNDNPHRVTAEQVGSYTKEEVDKLVDNVDVDLSEYVKNTDYATNDKHGIIKGDTALGIRINTSGAAYIDRATEAQIDAKADKFKPIVPSNLEYAVKSVGDGYYATEDAVFETSSFALTDFHYWDDGVNGHIATVTENSIVIDNTVNEDEHVQIACRGNILGFTFSVSGSGILRINDEYRRYEDETVVIPLTYLTKDLLFYGVDTTWIFTDMKIQTIKGMGNIDKALDSILDIQNGLIGGDVI